jgi:uncharacterized SAM-binding protein YcdF (DUF218 family)
MVRGGKSRKVVLIGGVALAAWLLAMGFVIFATVAMREPHVADMTADGIVVLTGTEQRIVEGARLLKDGRAGRMLVSGVNAKTRPEDILRLMPLAAEQFNCCVDLGYRALSTIGNAEEARSWASEHQFRSLIVVTSAYHMPRSLAELRLALPGIRLMPHAVAPKASVHKRPWWLSPATARTLLAEYIKYLPVAARLSVVRLLEPLEGGPLSASTVYPRSGSNI